jgi:hypothetical protein
VNNVPHLAIPLSISAAAIARLNRETRRRLPRASRLSVRLSAAIARRLRSSALRDPAFITRPVDLADIQQACETYEPRAIVRVEESPYNPADPTAAAVTVAVSVLQSEEM